MWRLPFATALAALPQPWRARFGLEHYSSAGRAAILSAVLESFTAFVALLVWYSHSVTHWAASALDSALRNGPEAQVPGQAIGFSALVLWCLHPLTWLMAYFAVEGMVRFLAAVSAGEILPLGPLAAVDWVWGWATDRAPSGDSLHTPTGKEQWHSLVSAVRQAAVARLFSELPDQLLEFTEGGDLVLEVRASRPKSEWTPPRLVAIANHYYRLESASYGRRPRPFTFRLRRLPAGVPGRRVLRYDPPHSPK